MEETKSKSQKKRDADALQKLGVKLVALKLIQLNRLPLPAPLYQAIIDAKTLKSNGAIRRQAQLIGKLMRAADNEAILKAYEDILNEESGQTAIFHEIERWREKLIYGGSEALTAFIKEHQPQDLQHFRNLVNKAAHEQSSGQNLGASKALFRFLRACLS